MILINLKNYIGGNDVLRFVKKIKSNKNKIIVCPPALHLKEVNEKSDLRVFSQAVAVENEKNTTGKVTLTSLKQIKIRGTLLNHSEHRIQFKDIKKIVKEAKNVGIKVVLCAENLKEVKKFKKLKPWAIAYEDPKLIGSGKSITKYKSQRVVDFVAILKKTTIIPLCGAGISSPEDYTSALALGCKGILVASAIATSQHPELFLKNI